MKHTTLTLLTGCLVAAMAGDAAAQGPESRVFAGVNFGVQTGSQTLTTTSGFDLYGERGSLTFDTEAGGGALFDVNVGVKVFGPVSVGVGYSRATSDSDGTIAGSAPHPLFFNRPRAFSGTATGLDRKQQMIHLSVGYTVNVGDNMSVLLYGGPSQFRLQQDIVGSVEVAEGANFASVVVQPVVQEQKESTWGGHVGADLSYYFTERFGAGGFLRWAGGSTDIEVLDASNLRQEVKTDVGGFQAGFGLRVRF